MHYSRVFACALLAANLVFVAASNATSNGSSDILNKRAIDASAFQNLPGGLLFKNGKQTSCEVALLSMKAGIVTASCFDYSSGTTVSSSTKYEVYLYNGTPNSAPIISTLSTSDIHLHPNYNPNTLENNLAIIEFNKQTTDPFKGYIVDGKYMVPSSVYLRRSFNTDTNTWNAPLISQMAGNPDECSDFSGLYVTNERNLLCTPYSTPSIVNSDCSVPYGALYTEGQNGMIAIAGIFTLSSVEGTSLCSGGARMYTYMTAMWNLSPLATSILGYPVDVMRNYIAETQTGTNVYSQNSPTVIDMSGKTIITGDVYPKQSRNSNLQTTAQPEPPASVSTSQASNENSNDKSVSDNATKDEVNTNIISDTRSNAPSHTTSDVLSDFPSDALSDVLSNLGGDDNNEKASSFSNELSKEIAEITATGGTINEDTYKSILAELSQAGLNNNSSEQQQQKSEGSDEKLSRTKIIVISVVVPIISLLIGFIAFLAYRAWISGKFKGHWDPQAEANHHRDAIFDLGGIYLDGTPPAYYRHSGSSSTLELNGNRAGRKSSDEKIEKD